MSANVIIVEPSRSIATWLGSFCTQRGATVALHSGMAQALASVRDNNSAAVITVAYQLDDGDGIALIYSLRALSQLATTPILFFTSDTNVETARTALVAGATEVFQKTETDAIEQAIAAAIAARALPPIQAGRALIVEDTQAIARLLEKVCEELGLASDTVHSAEEGFRVFQENNYQLAIIDIILAGLHSGIDLVRNIRRLPDQRARLPILVTSSYNDIARRIELLRSGADDFVSKPLIEEELVWRIRHLLQRIHWESAEPTPLQPNAIQSQVRAHFGLTSREAEICAAIVQGLPDKRIASTLGISFWTVRTHINHIFSKTGSFNRANLVLRVNALCDRNRSSIPA